MKTIISISFMLCLLQVHVFAAKQPYIVYMGAHSHPPNPTQEHFDQATNFHHQFLASYLGSHDEAKSSIFYSYNKYINGFAAILDDDVAAMIAENPRVISVFPSKLKKLHTTHSWEFMSLDRKSGALGSTSAWRKGNFGEDAIIAHLDTGIWPESKSFNDDGLGPIPSRWKGTCEGSGIPCNRKLIGSRFFTQGYLASGATIPKSQNNSRDYAGHGSHTMSTSAGSFVAGANIFGIANGTAKGGSPRARIASYKICYKLGCAEADILAAFDMAVLDGVDILSVSVGGMPSDYKTDAMAIGSFHAVQQGILVVCSAGNEGIFDMSVTNGAPWIFTVAASTLDRSGFYNYVELLNGTRFKGASLSPSLPQHRHYPLISGTQAKLPNATDDDASLCFPGTLDHSKVKGKILACLRGVITRIKKGIEAKQAGAVGLILCNTENHGDNIAPDFHYLPASHLTYDDGAAVLAYINSSKPNKAYAYISHPTAPLHSKPAPMMASFSSRGPYAITREILKPDITAPGVYILGAYTEAVGPSLEPSDDRQVPYTLLSGTSMACPHISGVAGLIKTHHPHWSPAAIRSAIMTSARTRDNTLKPMKNAFQEEADPFNYGAGHIRPNRAMKPGLVYDLGPSDYLDFLCAFGYNKTQISLFSNSTHECPEPSSPRNSMINLNYPSITVPDLSNSVTVTRRVRNVGKPGTYISKVRHPSGVSITVDPPTLEFERRGEEKSFTVTLKVEKPGRSVNYDFYGERNYTFGRLVWTDGEHFVRSPVVVGFLPS